MLDSVGEEEAEKIGPKYGRTLIETLRQIYGRGFAPGCADDAKLCDALSDLHVQSLSLLVRDHRKGELEGKIKRARRNARD
jgi:hypothetical protein